MTKCRLCEDEGHIVDILVGEAVFECNDDMQQCAAFADSIAGGVVNKLWRADFIEKKDMDICDYIIRTEVLRSMRRADR
ncbi:hypothetical protein LCGC14_2659860 [marine sediment metagenome]|uniref:Uncharacterized protein n=1 Tax=marine sediment metagenome TaxID=412755 RepID=A0A0F9AEK8_9ZZZZ